MAQYQTEAVVLSVRNWGEADKMLRLFSRDHGKITAAAFGARRPKSPLASGLQMFHTVELSLSTGERVDTVRGCRLVHRFPHLETDLAAMAYASFIDSVCYWSLYCQMPEDQGYTSLDVSVTNLAAVRSGKLIAEGRVVRSGRSISISEGTVKDETGRLLAYGASKLMCLEGKQSIRDLLEQAGDKVSLPPKFLP